ncbi:hypothetical protein ACP70R_019131 [Stipagrostis hirtigluma subsp. patula]
MSQGEQPRRPPEQQVSGGGAVRYGDVFAVGGELARTPIAPRDAAMMQEAEDAVLGSARRGGAASVMQSAATRNERLGAVARDEATEAAAEGGVAVSEARVPGGRVVTEFVADQTVGQYIVSEDDDAGGGAAAGGGDVAVVDGTKITIGEALEATAFSAGDQPVEPSDAAAIEAAVAARATGADAAPPDGLAAQALRRRSATPTGPRSATSSRDATSRLGGADKEVEREDAARVVAAELRGREAADAAATRPGGVAASIAAAAWLNRGRQ